MKLENTTPFLTCWCWRLPILIARLKRIYYVDDIKSKPKAFQINLKKKKKSKWSFFAVTFFTIPGWNIAPSIETNTCIGSDPNLAFSYDSSQWLTIVNDGKNRASIRHTLTHRVHKITLSYYDQSQSNLLL